MTRKKLAKKLKIAGYNVEDPFWEMVEVEQLMKLINTI